MDNGVMSVIFFIPLVTIPRLNGGDNGGRRARGKGGGVDSRCCRRGVKRKQIRKEGKSLYDVKVRWGD